jgi:hypothetical protein
MHGKKERCVHTVLKKVFSMQIVFTIIYSLGHSKHHGLLYCLHYSSARALKIKVRKEDDIAVEQTGRGAETEFCYLHE